jgi:glucokinase
MRDIGGVHSRIAYYIMKGGRRDCLVKEIYPSVEYSGLDAIVGKCVAPHGARSGQVCFAVAGPVRDCEVRTTCPGQ